jgi:hypothetical protein
VPNGARADVLFEGEIKGSRGEGLRLENATVNEPGSLTSGVAAAEAAVGQAQGVVPRQARDGRPFVPLRTERGAAARHKRQAEIHMYSKEYIQHVTN